MNRGNRRGASRSPLTATISRFPYEYTGLDRVNVSQVLFPPALVNSCKKGKNITHHHENGRARSGAASSSRFAQELFGTKAFYSFGAGSKRVRTLEAPITTCGGDHVTGRWEFYRNKRTRWSTQQERQTNRPRRYTHAYPSHPRQLLVSYLRGILPVEVSSQAVPQVEDELPPPREPHPYGGNHRVPREFQPHVVARLMRPLQKQHRT